MKYFLLTLMVVSLNITGLKAQKLQDSSAMDYAAMLNQLEAELDSFSIFSLIDSVLLASYEPPSELSIRIGYNSNVSNAGRTYGLDQYGFTPGISFFHKKGFFADYTGFWNSAFDPKYNLSLFSGGYMWSPSLKLSTSFSYDHWLYHSQTGETTTYPNNSLNTTINYDMKYLWANLDYSFMFGNNQNAHRITPGLNGYFQIDGFWFIDNITFLPGISMLYGNENVTIQFNGRLIDELKSNEYLVSNLRSDDFKEFLQGVNLSQEQQRRILIIENSRRLSEQEKRKLISAVYISTAEVQNYIYEILDQKVTAYGIMNWNLSFPISIRVDNWSFLFSYSYNIPEPLPGETIQPEPVGLFSTTVSYRIKL